MNQEEINLLKYKEFWNFCFKATLLNNENSDFEKMSNCKKKMIAAYKRINIPIITTIFGNQEEIEEEQQE